MQSGNGGAAVGRGPALEGSLPPGVGELIGMQACCLPRTVLGRCPPGGRASPSGPPRPWPRSAQMLSGPVRLCSCVAGAAQIVCLNDGRALGSDQS